MTTLLPPLREGRSRGAPASRDLNDPLADQKFLLTSPSTSQRSSNTHATYALTPMPPSLSTVKCTALPPPDVCATSCAKKFWIKAEYGLMVAVDEYLRVSKAASGRER